MMELRGDIPGLLRRGSPCRWLRMTNDMREGVCYFAPLRPTVLLLCHDPCRQPATPNPADVTLDLSDPTGRFHARLWLKERGYDMGTEDSAEVLAWSVLSVSRGGGPIRLVMGHWWQQGVTWRRDGWRGLDKVTAAVGPTNCSGVEWEILTWLPGGTSRDAGHYGRDFASIEAARAACDAAAIASRWALTNPDGTLTLPPLPGAK